MLAFLVQIKLLPHFNNEDLSNSVNLSQDNKDPDADHGKPRRLARRRPSVWEGSQQGFRCPYEGHLLSSGLFVAP